MASRLEHGHQPSEIARRLREGPRVSHLRDWVYGGIDGTVTTFAIMAGVVGASLSTSVVIIPAPWWRTGLETLAIGMLAAGVAYLLGDFLGGLV